MIIQFITKRFKISTEKDGTIISSYAIWVSTLLGSFFLFLKTALEQTENTIEIIIYSKTINDTFMQVMQRIVIYTGFSFLFTFLSYYIVHNVLKLLFGNRTDSIEIERNNKSYFLIKGLTTIFLVFSLLTIFEHFLKWFAPAVDTPFYH
ncbi:hypothetical protein [Flavobacterium sp. XGLA_31]|uniref:hypothetical protein n=1 Tax=Flavobacterium sp. XGLA_31 TaxID=3447666 RepID=UPI003F361391